MTTAMKPHQMLLVLLMLLFVVNLPSCSSEFILSARYIQSLREARREAYTPNSGQPGGWRVMNINTRFVNELVDRAARQANVKPTNVLQGFYKVR